MYVEVYERVSTATNQLYNKEGAAFTAGFLTSQLVAAVSELPKTKQKMFLAALESIVRGRVE